MSRWNLAVALEPISPDKPCGENLEDSGEIALLEAYQIFGQDSLDPVVPQKGDPVPKEVRKSKSDRPPNWNEIGDLAAGMLAKSKDVRILVHLAAASLWTAGPRPFVETLGVGAKWLGEYWTQVHPLVDEDAIFRRNALNCLTDRAAILEGLRRAPLVESRQHGRVTLRDLELLAGTQKTNEHETPPDAQRINAAFAEMPIGDLRALHAAMVEGRASLAAMDDVARTTAGIEAAPEFDPLVAQLNALENALSTQLTMHPDGVAERDAAAGGAGATAAGGAVAVGAIRSREDAIRALDAAAEFFRRNEPSSPVPLILDRAKRLIAKDFLEVIADMAPDALSQVRAVGGLRD